MWPLLVYIRDMLYVILHQRIGENKWPDYREQSKIFGTDLS